MEIIFIYICLAIIILLGFFVYRINVYVLLFYSSLISSMTLIGTSNINLAFLILAIFMLLLSRTYNINLRFLSVLFFTFVILWVVAQLPIIQGYSPILATAKWGKCLFVFLPLTIYPKVNILKKKDLIGFVRSFYFVSAIMGIFYALYIDADVGIYNIFRFSGFFDDANYFAMICFCFIITLNYFFNYKEVSADIKILSFFIVISQSFTIIFIMLFYFIVRMRKNNKLDRYVWYSPFVFLFLGLIYISIISILYSHLQIKVYDDYATNPLSYKLNSLLFRLQPQFGVLDMIKDHPLIIFTGYGSGQTSQLFGRVLHNFYMQLFFDNGIVFFVIFCMFVGYVFYITRPPKILVLTFALTNLLFDNVFMFALTFIFVVIVNFRFLVEEGS